MFQAPTSDTKQQNDPARSHETTGPASRAPARPHGSQQLAHLHSTYGNQAVLRMLELNRIQRKCVDHGSRTQTPLNSMTPETSCERLRAADQTASLHRQIAEPVQPGPGNMDQPALTSPAEGSDQPAPMDNPDAGASAPTQKVSLSGPVCGNEYGATAKYCYDVPPGWWFKEDVSMDSNTCGSGSSISQTKTPFLNKGTCITDTITNTNGPPSKVAPCKTVTKQTVFIGPTQAAVEQYKYSNKQVVEVTKTSDEQKVKTSSAEASTECNWS